MAYWHCPHCPAMAHTTDESTPLHLCPDLAGLAVPLVPEGMKARLVVIEREDYLGKERVTYDGNGRPVVGVITERVHGFDTTVYLTTATASVDDLEEARCGVD